MKDFYAKYKEWIDQPLHVLMGAVLSFGIAAFLAMKINILLAFFIGGAVSRIVWMGREWWQHHDHDHEPRYWWSKDLLFIDIGVALGLVGVGLLIWF